MSSKKANPSRSKPERLQIPNPFPFYREDPLKRIPTKPGEFQGESKPANQALRDYAEMGPRRSLDKLHAFYRERRLIEPLFNPPTLVLWTLRGWSMVYGWVERVELWDRQEEARRRKEREARRLEIEEQDYTQAQALRELADKILAETPQFIRTSRRRIKGENGEPDTIIITMGIDAPTMVKLVETGSKLARLSAGMTQETKDLNIKGDALAELPDEILALIAAGKVSEEDLVDILNRGE